MNYVYSTRFQPFNNENLEELRWLLHKVKNDAKDDKIIFGIVNPNPKKIEENDSPLSWKRFRVAFNPLTYWERYQIIELIIDLLNCRNQVSGIVPMPRPSVNMKSANNFLPPKGERIMCVPFILKDALEQTKIEGLKNQGENFEIIPAHEFNPINRIISPELITCLIALRYKHWDQFVPEIIRTYIKSIGISERVRREFSYEEAEEELNMVYNQMIESELKSEMEKHFKEYLNVSTLNQKVHAVYQVTQ